MPSSAFIEYKARLQARIDAQEQLVDLLSDKADRLDKTHPQYEHCHHMLSLATDHLNVLKNSRAAVQWHSMDKLLAGGYLDERALDLAMPAKPNLDASLGSE
jgi:hypothetical protein